MNIHCIISQLKATSSRIDKETILYRHKNNSSLAQFFKLALDSQIRFYIKQIPKYQSSSNPTILLQEAMESLSVLSSRGLTGNAGRDHLHYLLENLEAEDALVIERIILKNPDCGVQSKTINKIFGKNTIFEYPIAKATAYDEKVIKNINFDGGALSQMKIDGARCTAIIDKDITMLSSGANEFDFCGYFDNKIMAKDGSVIDGELVMVELDGSLMPRKKSNGLINRAVHGTFPKEMLPQVRFVLFDYIPLEDWKKGKSKLSTMFRFNHTKYIVKASDECIELVDTQIVYSEADALAHFKKLYSQGFEGTVLKDSVAGWEGKRSKYHIKYKGILSCDLKIVGFKEGSGRLKGRIGSFDCVSEDGLVSVNVGGLTDKQREIPFSEWNGKIVEVYYNERIKNKTEGSVWSLFLPRFGSVRWDKLEADNIVNIP